MGKYFIVIIGAVTILAHIGSIYAMKKAWTYGLVPGMSMLAICVVLDFILFLAIRADNMSKMLKRPMWQRGQKGIQM